MERVAKLAFILIPLLCSGCSRMGLLEMDGFNPAEIAVPASVKSIVLVSVFERKNNRAMAESPDQVAVFKSDSIISNRKSKPIIR